MARLVIVLEVLLWLALASACLCVVSGAALSVLMVRDRLRARRVKAGRCACGAYSAGWGDWVEVAGWRHTAALCQPLREVIR